MVGNSPPQHFACRHCGRIVRRYEQNMTADTQLRLEYPDSCFECAFWLNAHAHPIPNSQIINGQLFSFPPVVRERGRVRHILTVKGEMIDSTELFNYGPVPDRFRELFPDTANFVKCSVYRKLKSNFTCRKLGCWDRTYCYWYHGKEQSWNQIPKNHKPGDEHCPMYINILNPHG